MTNLITFITILVIPLICFLIIMFAVFGNKKKISKEESGFEVARKILDLNNLNNMYIVETRSSMNDIYDFNKHVIKLSTSVFHENYVTSCAVGAYFASMAVMDKEQDSYLKLKSMFAPIVDFLLVMSYLFVFIGAICNVNELGGLAIAMILLILIYHLCMIPLVLKINKRALIEVSKTGILNDAETNQVKSLLMMYSINGISSMIYGIVSSIMNLFDNRK